MPRDAAELARMLAAQTPAIVAELLPAGRREGSEWRVGSLHGERGRSLAVHLVGVRAGIWSDFSSGQAGDLLDLVALVRFGGDLKQAMAWARARLGMDTTSPAAAPSRPAPAAPPPPADDEDAKRRKALARRLFIEATPALRGTPAACYLAGRGIDLAELGRQPRALRFHPALWNSESRRTWPAMVGAITGPDGSQVALHRTWLHQHDGQWKKAPLQTAKMTLGDYAGASIRLWRGATGKPLSEAGAGETAVIAEGIETALSIAIACPALRVLAAVSIANMGRLVLPPAVRNVTLAADNDGDNPAAAAALRRAVHHLAADGRTVRIAMPEQPGTDWNDVLQEAEA
jgi:hypothetical protein